MRLFLAVLLPDAVRDAIAAAVAPARAVAPRVRWVRAEHLHLTMKFLGERPDGDDESLAAAVAPAIASIPRFEATVRGTGAFPNFRRPRVVWLGMHPPTSLGAIAARLDEALIPCGVAAESRPFRAHVTLGRVGEVLTPVAAASLEQSLGQVRIAASFSVREVVMMQSTLGSGGPTYRALHHLPLGGA
jgi:RNA 2',3'-cyclic 3'-phosphodiesterase